MYKVAFFGYEFKGFMPFDIMSWCDFDMRLVINSITVRQVCSAIHQLPNTKAVRLGEPTETKNRQSLKVNFANKATDEFKQHVESEIRPK